MKKKDGMDQQLLDALPLGVSSFSRLRITNRIYVVDILLFVNEEDSLPPLQQP